MNMFLASAVDEKILFLGEGNFSFSANFVKNLENLGHGTLQLLTNIHATCFQAEEEETQLRSSNIKYLANKGVQIHYSVDATKLLEHPTLNTIKFNKVIFMFPHTGGKMKIHLNRDLLRALFPSVETVLAADGQLIITLCKGQGGTPFDRVQRRPEDTWRILEISQEADFSLVRVAVFPAQLFQEYSQVGYRSLQKGFHTEGAVVHVFQYSPGPQYTPVQTLEHLSTLESSLNNHANHSESKGGSSEKEGCTDNTYGCLDSRGGCCGHLFNQQRCKDDRDNYIERIDKINCAHMSSDIIQAEHRRSKNIQSKKRSSENTQAEHRSSENKQAEHRSSDNIQAEHKKSKNIQAEHRSSENTQAEHRRSENAQAEHRNSENTQAEHRRSDNIQAVHRSLDNVHPEYRSSDNIQAEHRRSKNIQAEHMSSDNIQAEHRSPDNIQTEQKSSGERVQLYPLVHKHHLSFWLNESIGELCAKDVERVGRACLGELVQEVLLVGSYQDEVARQSLTVQVTYKSTHFPLGPRKAFDLHYNVLGRSLVNIYKVELR